MSRKLKSLLLLLFLAADIWFLFMIRAVFYSPDRAFQLAEEKLPDAIRAHGIDPDSVGDKVLYNGKSLIQRIIDIPSIYDGGRISYSVHEFLWPYEYGFGEQYILIGISPNGTVTSLGYLYTSPFDNMVPYQR